MGSEGVKHGFTLIELLVVITIIAVLAALLFPVFAQSKQAAQRANDLTNIKQLALAHHMYWQDFDDRTVTSWTYGLPGDFSFMIQPYVNNRDIMRSPGRNVSMDAMAACSVNLRPGGVDNPFGEPRVWGYGYNTGHDWDDGTGLTNELDNRPPRGNGESNVTFQYGGVKVAVTYRDYVKQGKPLSTVPSPSNVLLIGNTGDTIVQGLGRADLTPLSVFPLVGWSPTVCDRVRLAGFPTWGDAIQGAFVDGHCARLLLDLQTLSWKMESAIPSNPAKPVVRNEPKFLRNACVYLADYDGRNNPAHCSTGDAK